MEPTDTTTTGRGGRGCADDCGCGGHDERRPAASPHNPPGRSALDYRVGEYGSFLAAMLDRLASPAYPALRRLTVRTADDPAIALLDAWAVLGDLLTFHSERIADEGYLRTAREQRSLALLGRLVGHRPRPGIAADTHLAYTVDRDPRSGEDIPVLIPRGARSHSVPAVSREEPHTFETDEELTARRSWNELTVRRRRPALLTPDDLAQRSELYVAGTDTGLHVGDRLLFLFGGGEAPGAGQRLLLPAARLRVDREDGVTAVALPRSAPPSLFELLTELRQWITEPEGPGDPEEGEEPAEPSPEHPNPRPVSRLVDDFDAQVLAPLRADLDGVTTPEEFAHRLEDPLDRLAEAEIIARPYEHVAAWFERLAAVVAELRERAIELGPSRTAAEDAAFDGRVLETETQAETPAETQAGTETGSGGTGHPAVPSTPPAGAQSPGSPRSTQSPQTAPGPQSPAALRTLGALLPALRSSRSVRPPAAARTAARDPRRLFGPESGLATRLLTALDPHLDGGELHAAWRRATPAATATGTAAAVPAPAVLRDLLAMRVTAAPFGATAPLKPVQDERGRIIRQSDWPLTGSALTTMRVVFDTAGKVPVKAEFVHAQLDASWQRSENLPNELTFDLGPGTVVLSAQSPQEQESGRTGRRAAAAEPAEPAEPGVTAQLLADLPERTLFVSRPAEDGTIHVSVADGGSHDWRLAPGERRQETVGGYEVYVRRSTASEQHSVEIGIATVPSAPNRHVLPLDTVHDSLTVGSWVAVERPRKGTPDEIPGDPALRRVITRVTAVRTVAYTNYGITGRGTELTLADPWLDDQDVLLSHIRDTTVHAGGEPLRMADEPLGEDVHGNELELDDLHEGLAPGRHIVVTGERSDIPGVAGLRATEFAVIAGVEQRLDPELPGDHVHTVLTLTADLAHRYDRDTVRVLGNVVPASHGESRDEPVGSGDTTRPNQTFTLWRAPLAWLPSDNALGAVPALEVRVDGLLWHRVDSLAGRGPRERVYVLGAGADGRPTVTFGDGVNGARLPTGHDNVRARYRHGTEGPGGTEVPANLPAGRVTQAVTRPLGVTGVTNPLPATGGAAGDGPGLTRRTIPLAVSALDRLVSVPDYADFARSRAGVGRAAARELFDGRRRVVHVTVAGVDDVPLGPDSDTLRALRSALAEHGDARLPVRVDVRELVVLLLAARVRVAADHSFETVEPRLRQALLRRLGYPGRELGQPALLSEVLATAHTVPGVEYLDVDVFTGVPVTGGPDGLVPPADLDGPRSVVPARQAEFDETTYRVTAEGGETLTEVAARHGITLTELLRLNPDIDSVRRLPKGRSVLVFRGVRPAQLTLLSLEVPDTLILTEVTR
ncbi:putative baseplate assembly protein [Streptomyces sp. WAC 00631]|uniref:putative baseplate assembly protein n=1 Tax=Streptomyces sp. WAC 00631 TaxID=2203201 RepID=UPI000F79E3BF